MAYGFNLRMATSSQLRISSWRWVPVNSPDGLSGSQSKKTGVHHIFDVGFDAWPSAKQSVAVVGGGISAGQVALRLMSEGHDVHLIARHSLREHQFDSDPGWLGPKNMTVFSRQKDLKKRRAMISEARHSGSVPPDVRRAIRRAVDKKAMGWHQTDVDSVKVTDEGITLHLQSDAVVDVDRVFLATGFCSQRPGGDMVDTLIESASLPLLQLWLSCGRPHLKMAPARLRVRPLGRTRARSHIAQYFRCPARW